jgi:hypothetical protein
MLKDISTTINSLNKSKIFAGVMMLLLNVGGRQISKELSFIQENILEHKVVRRLFIFVAVFIATKDIKISLIVTVAFIILVTGLFNEESIYCILPKDKLGNKKKISKNEYLMAKQIVNIYEKQQK